MEAGRNEKLRERGRKIQVCIYIYICAYNLSICNLAQN